MMKLLIAEDDKLISDLYIMLFKFENYDVSLAENGEEAIKKAREIKPSLILLDIMMPKMDGIEALKRLKSNPETQSIPVVMLSNLASPEEIDNTLKLGAVKYIVKSEHLPKDLAKMVKEIVDKYNLK